MKTIWIVNEYAGNPKYGMGVRHYYLAKGLVKKGYNVYIFSASFSHLLTNYPECKAPYAIEDTDGVKFIWLKTIRYSNAHSIRRVFKWWQFSLMLYITGIKNKIDKPDIIIASIPEIFHLVPSYYLSKKYDAKFVVEVRDIWPLSLIELGKLSVKHPLLRVMNRIEKSSLKRADAVISVLPNFENYLLEYNIPVKNLFIIPNGVCIDDYKNVEQVPEDIISKIPDDKFITIYAGTFGKANALEDLIKAADILRKYGNIHFILVGKGMEEENLKSLVRKLNLKNITFLPPVSKKQIQDLLKRSDVCYIGLKRKNIFKYGVSPNKIFDYMYAEKPIVYAIDSGNNIVKDVNCGVSVEAENPKSIAEGVLKLYKMDKEKRKQLGKNGKKYLLKYHTYEKLTNKLEDLIHSL